MTVRRGTGQAHRQRDGVVLPGPAVQLCPEPVTLRVTVTDPDGRALQGASVTFTLAVPGVPAITSSTLTTGEQRARRVHHDDPEGRDHGPDARSTVIVQTKDFGDTTDRTVITISK